MLRDVGEGLRLRADDVGGGGGERERERDLCDGERPLAGDVGDSGDSSSAGGSPSSSCSASSSASCSASRIAAELMIVLLRNVSPSGPQSDLWVLVRSCEPKVLQILLLAFCPRALPCSVFSLAGFDVVLCPSFSRSLSISLISNFSYICIL